MKFVPFTFTAAVATFFLVLFCSSSSLAPPLFAVAKEESSTTEKTCERDLSHSQDMSAFISTKSLSLAVADEIASLAINACKIHGFKPISVVVMDPAGHEIVTKRMDGCPPSEC